MLLRVTAWIPSVSKAAYRWLEVTTLLAILALAAYLRLANLRDNPGWYTDEATHLDIALHLLRGQTQYLAINQSTLLFARLPLFEWMLAGLLALGGEPMSTLRAFTATCGVGSVVALYAVLRRISRDVVLALFAALLLAIYPPAVLYSRFGFSYNLLTPLALLALLGMGEYADTQRRRWLALAALAVGLGAVSDLLMLSFVGPLVIVVIARRWKDALWAAPLAALPLSLYAALMLITAPRAFLFDAHHTLFRLNTLTLPQQLAALADNAAVLLTQEPWFAAGLFGLFLFRPARLRWLSLLLCLLPLIQLGRTAALYSLSFYYLIPFLPFVALGVAALAHHGAEFGVGALAPVLRVEARTPNWRMLIIGALVAAPFVASVKDTLDQVEQGFVTAIDPFLIDPADARAAARFINHSVAEEEVVIASPAMAWLIHARAADFQMAVAADGHAAVHLPASLPVDRFAFDPRLSRARFVVVDNLWRNWAAVHVPAVAEMIHEVETWPLVFQAGEIEVYQRR